jgi:hypothetical protein
MTRSRAVLYLYSALNVARRKTTLTRTRLRCAETVPATVKLAKTSWRVSVVAVRGSVTVAVRMSRATRDDDGDDDNPLQSYGYRPRPKFYTGVSVGFARQEEFGPTFGIEVETGMPARR